MAKPSFVPRDLLVVPLSFGKRDDVEWSLAYDYEGAILLARAREQHDLALAINLLMEKYQLSKSYVARELGVPRATLTRKLTGAVPAQENDIIAWCWLTGESRRSYRPEHLLADPSAVILPRLGPWRA